MLGEDKVLASDSSGDFFVAQPRSVLRVGNGWHGEAFIASEADAKAIRKLGLPLMRLAKNHWRFTGQ